MTKVLIADDDRAARSLLARVVEGQGLVALHASTGRRALEMLMDDPSIALLIADAMMPEMSGRELVRILRGQEAYRALPVIMVSGVVGVRDIEDLKALGPFRFLVKPVQRAVLEECVREFLGLRQAIEQ